MAKYMNGSDEPHIVVIDISETPSDAILAILYTVFPEPGVPPPERKYIGTVDRKEEFPDGSSTTYLKYEEQQCTSQHDNNDPESLKVETQPVGQSPDPASSEPMPRSTGGAKSSSS